MKDQRRIWSMSPMRIVVAVYAVSTIAFWFIPLLNVLHAESAAVLAFVSFFAVGWSSHALMRSGLSDRPIIVAQLTALAVPLVLMLAGMIWSAECSVGVGLMFFGLFPVVTTVLATGAASLIFALRIRHHFVAILATGLLLSALTPIYDLGLFPQLYTYNHIFGGVLGPIYDEELALRPGLFAFRTLSLLWAFLTFLSATILRRGLGWLSPITAGAVAVTIAIFAGYAYSSDLGWNTTHRVIQESLGSTATSTHFAVFFDRASFLPDELDRLLQEMEFRYETIASALNEEVSEPILVYLYPTASRKGQLTGSRYTSVTPVWMRRPQIHMLARRTDDSFDHELVHVFSREFGAPVIKASTAVGLVEGLASALEAPKGGPSSRELMAASIQSVDSDSAAVVDALVESLNAFGFWTGRGAVSYAANGSFVDFLLRTHGAEKFKIAYKSADFEAAYGRTLDDLASDWYADLKTAAVSAAALPAAQRLFSVPSLFEAECPHEMPNYVVSYRHATDRIAVHDTAAAIGALRRSVEANTEYLPSRVLLVALLIRTGDLDSARQALPEDSSSIAYPVVSVLAGDVAAMEGDVTTALERYESVLDSLPEYAVEARAAVLLRRYVADRSKVIGWLVGTPSTLDAAVALAADPARSAIAVSAHLRRREYTAGCEAGQSPADYLVAGFSNAESLILEQERLLSLGENCEYAGQLDLARVAYRDAGNAYSLTASTDLASLAQDRLKRVRWKQSHGRSRRNQ